MYLIYIDESGDEKLNISSAIAIPANNWLSCFEKLKRFRHDIKRSDGIFVHTELHAWKFISGRGQIGSDVVTKGRRCEIFNGMLQMATTLPGARLFSAVSPTKPAETAYTALLQGINRFLQEWNSYAIIICDEGKEAIHTELVRQMQNPENTEGNRILEDPFFKPSNQSYFIQLTDFCAYALLRKERPIESKTKYGLDKAFNLLIPISEGIIRTDS